MLTSNEVFQLTPPQTQFVEDVLATQSKEGINPLEAATLARIQEALKTRNGFRGSVVRLFLGENPPTQNNEGIEKKVVELFGKDEEGSKFGVLGVAWYRFEVWKNQLEASKDWEKRNRYSGNPIESENKKGITTLCIDDINNDTRLFKTPHLSHPATLQHAIKAEFLNLIKTGSKYGWLEALFPQFLEMSVDKPHYIYTQTKDESGKLLPYPQILATGLIHDGCDLTRDKAFRHEGWESLLTREDFKKAIANHKKMNEGEIDCNLSKIPSNPQTLEEVEEGLIKASPNRVCEFIHFTGKPQHLFSALQAFTQRMSENGKDFAFAIAEKHMLPTMVNIVEGLTRRKTFLTQAEYQINEEDKSPTCKVILLNENMSKALKEVSLGIVMQGMGMLQKGKSLEEVIKELKPIWKTQQAN